MNKLLLLFGITAFLLSARSVSADSGVCNKTCQVNEDCGQGYRCYVGICRALSCPSSPNCECIGVTPTPQAIPKIVEELRVTPTPLPKATPIASPSSQIKKAPKTGVSLPAVWLVAGLMGLTGLWLKGLAQNA